MRLLRLFAAILFSHGCAYLAVLSICQRHEWRRHLCREKAQKGEESTMEDIMDLCDVVRETGFAIHRYHKHGHLEKVYEIALAIGPGSWDWM